LVDELLHGLKFHTTYDHGFMEGYAAKEVRRFSNQLLFDPITRVAREPIRKLQPEGRLLGALKLLLSSGVSPTFLMVGIAASLSYLEHNDNDYQQLSELNNFGLPMFLYYHLGLEPNSLESAFIVAKLPEAQAYIKREIL
jgi:mannitol-1-phosphate 5-dehydrogenase